MYLLAKVYSEIYKSGGFSELNHNSLKGPSKALKKNLLPTIGGSVSHKMLYHWLPLGSNGSSGKN